MTTTHVFVAAFLTVTGFVNAYLPFPAVPVLGGGGFVYHGGAGAFNRGFGSFPAGYFSYPGMIPPMLLPAHTGRTVGSTHTVSHTSAAGTVPHPTGPHISTSSKTVTVGHHLPTTHVTTVHHTVPAVTGHVPHVSYGAGFPVAMPYIPSYPYGPGLSYFNPQYTSVVKHETTPFVTHSAIVNTNKVFPASVGHPSTMYSYQNYNPPFASVVTKTDHFPTGSHHSLPAVATVHHQTVPHVAPAFGVSHHTAAFSNTLPSGKTNYQQITMHPGYGFLPGTSFDPAFGVFETPFPFINAGLRGEAFSSSGFHTVRPHPLAVDTLPFYPAAFSGYPYRSYNPFGFYSTIGSPVTSSVTKTLSQKATSSNKN